MAFAGAVFDGHALLDGVRAFGADDVRDSIPLYVRDIGPLLQRLQPVVLVDARMRKHAAPEVQRGLADLTIGLGPDLVAGRRAHVVIETSWEGLEQDVSVVRRVAERFGSELALDCRVIEPGRVTLGGVIELLEGG
jgi:hypothetical protein